MHITMWQIVTSYLLGLRARPESDPPEKDYYLRIVSNDTTYRPRHILNNDWQSKSAVRYVINAHLKVIYHPLYSMNNFVTNKAKLPQDGAQVFP